MIPQPKLILTAAMAILLLSTPVRAEEPPAFKSQMEKKSYAAGVDMARNFKKQGIEIDPAFFIRGLQDGFSGQARLMDEGDLRKYRKIFTSDVRREQAAKRRSMRQQSMATAEDNRKAGEAFLAENKTKEGVVTLPSGLQYRVLKEGSGAKPTDADAVELSYRGTFVDGTEFDSTAVTGPAMHVVSEVFVGWREALKLMPAGSRWVLFMPPGLTMGSQRAFLSIGPNTTVIYEMELLSIK